MPLSWRGLAYLFEGVEEMGSAIRLILITPLLGLLAAVGIMAVQIQSAFAWDIHALCEQQRVVGTIDIPHNSQHGLPYNVFVEAEYPDGHREWVQGAGQDITKTGVQPFSIDVSQAPEIAVQLRVRYKDKNGHYGPEYKDLQPCPKPPTATPTNTPTKTATPVTLTVTKTSAPPTKTSTPVIPTNTPVTPTRTSTSVPPVNTPTRVSTLAPPVPPATPAPCDGICLPETGGGDQDKTYSSGQIALGSVAGVLAIAGIFALALGGLVYFRVKD